MTKNGNFSRRCALQRLAVGSLSVALTGCLVGGAGPATLPLPVFRRARFPLRREPGLRHLLDADGQPFLLHGDAAWSLLVQLRREEVATYLDDRLRRGFNTILVNLLEHKYAVDAPRNRAGDAPLGPGEDYRQPNPRYFDHAAWVVSQAAERGMLVLLAASYIGCCGSDGWYAEMQRNGLPALREYGRFLGQRFRAFDNIVWVHGGDANPIDASPVAEVARGIRDADPTKLHTGHTGPGYEALQVYASPEWMDLNNIYTYDPVLPLAQRAWRRAGPVPFFLIESEYEGENRRAPDVRIRAQAWQAMLGGAMGQVVGNNPIWHFASPKPITPFTLTWQEALDSEASRSMSQLRRLLESGPWWQLQPDLDGRLLAGGACEGHYGAAAAATADGAWMLVHVPRGQEIALRIPPQSAALLEARWFDPVGGAGVEPVPGSLHQRGGLLHALPPAQRNAGGDADWVLSLTRPGAT